VKKSCGAWLLAYVAIAGAIAAAVFHRLPVVTVALWTGIIAGFFGWLGVAYLIGIPGKIREVGRMRRARDGEPPRDGERVAIIGRISPSGPALTAPLSGAQCVAYDYDIKSTYGDEGATYYSGFALTPSVIQGPSGSIRLLAWPDIKLPQQFLFGDDVRARAQEYISGRTFSEGGLSKIREGWAQLMEVYKDDDGSVSSDRKFPEAPSELITARYREKHVPAGAQVCVIGRYSAQRGGIVPAPDAPIMEQATLEVGEPDSFAGRARRGIVGYFIGGVIFVGAILAGLIGLYAFVPLEAAEQMTPSMRFSWPEIRLERELDQHVRPHIASLMHTDWQIPVEGPAGTARGRVRNGDSDRDVSRATASKNGDVVTVDIDGVVVSFDLQGRDLKRLNILGREVDLSKATVRLLEYQGSEVAGRLTYWSDDLACRIAFRAAPR
jgi:hypothetical protein